MSETSSWFDGDLKASTVIQQVDAVAVYTNTADDIVIRQRNSLGDDDSMIVIPKSAVASLIKALKSELKA